MECSSDIVECRVEEWNGVNWSAAQWPIFNVILYCSVNIIIILFNYYLILTTHPVSPQF